MLLKGYKATILRGDPGWEYWEPGMNDNIGKTLDVIEFFHAAGQSCGSWYLLAGHLAYPATVLDVINPNGIHLPSGHGPAGGGGPDNIHMSQSGLPGD
jgi:hypothetical protein